MLDNERRDNDWRDNDDQLMAELQSFGRTLETATNEPMRHTEPPASADSGDLVKSLTPEHGRQPAWWLLAAAIVLLAAGFGLGLLWPNEPTAIESVGNQEDADTDLPESIDGSLQDGEQSSIEPAPEPMPSTIERVDSSVLISAAELEHRTGDSDAQSRAKVAAQAVVDELVTLEVFPGSDRQEVMARLATDGFTVGTTLDPEAEQAALSSIAEIYPSEFGRGDELGIVTINNEDASIAAIVSSEPSSDVPLLRAQLTGSAFKSFVLAALFEDGYSPTDTVRADGPCSFPLDENIYTVGGSFQVPASIAAATRASNNCAFVRLGQIVGLNRVVTMATAQGVTLPADAESYLSLPVGSVPVTAKEMAGAYGAFANEGLYEQPWLVATVTDRFGEVIYEHQPSETRAMTERTAALVTHVLESNVESGTGSRAQLAGGQAAAGKTGTTNDFVDAWFVGYTDYYTTAVWLGDPVGNDPIRIPGWQSFGGALPATIWGDYMSRLHEDLTPRPFDEVVLSEGERLVVAEEPVFCEEPFGAFQGRPVGIELVDTDGDGESDCLRPVPAD